MFIDAIFVISTGISLCLVIWHPKGTFFSRGHRILLSCLILFTLIYSLCLFIERANISSKLERLEDIIGATLPMWWAFVLYGFVQELFKHDLEKSERLFRGIFDQTFQLTGLLSLDGIVLAANKTALATVNSKEEDALGKPFCDTMWWSHSEQQQQKLKQAIKKAATGATVRFEATHPLSDGNEFHVDFSLKPITSDTGEVIMLLAEGRDINERKHFEEELQLAKFSLDNASVSIYWINENGSFIYANRHAYSNLGYTQDELLALSLWDIDSITTPEYYAQQWKDMSNGESAYFNSTHQRKDGSSFPVEIYVRQAEFKGIQLNFAFVNDITERITMETQLVQAQKMESIGRLAGGVAHDFNNMLSIILGSTSMLLLDTLPTDPSIEKLKEIHKAAERSSNLTKQLLAFARKQTIAPKVLNLSETLPTMLSMLKRLIGEDIELIYLSKEDLWNILIDPSQIDQVLANLCVNARDAIPGIGMITIQIDNVHFDKGYCHDHVEYMPGDYVLLSISDNGDGIQQEVLEHLFEPFYTTKEVGKGSGLGLATVYGIIKQNEGFIIIQSEIGQGTTFNIYLPRHEGSHENEDINDSIRKHIDVRGHETIMLVEDEAGVMKTTRAILERQGYKVYAATAPEAAIRLCKENNCQIDLLITDVVMPGMSGKEFASKMQEMYPQLKCLFMSGYTSDVIAHHGVLEDGIAFIQKPFELDELIDKVRDTLNINISN